MSLAIIQGKSRTARGSCNSHETPMVKEFRELQRQILQASQSKPLTKPTTPVPVYVAASGPTVAEIAGRIGDGFLTVNTTEDHYRNVLSPAVEKGAKEAGRDPKNI